MENMSFLEQSTTINNEENVFNGLVKNNFRDLANADYFFFISRLPNGKNFLIDYMEEILASSTDLEIIIYLYLRVFSIDDVILKLLAYHPNIRVRSYFMLALVNNHASEISRFYPNIEEFLVNKNENGEIVEIIDENILSEITVSLLNVESDIDMFSRLKEFILANYSQNHLLSAIYNAYVSNFKDNASLIKKHIETDIKRLYETSSESEDEKKLLISNFLRVVKNNE